MAIVQYFSRLHWLIAQIFIGIVGILTALIWTTPDGMSLNGMVVFGIGWTTVAATRFSGHALQLTGLNMMIAGSGLSCLCMFIVLACLGGHKYDAAVVFTCIAASTLTISLAMSVRAKDGNLVLVERIGM